MRLPWPTKKLGDKDYFEILGSGINNFNGEKKYISTSSVDGNQIITVEGIITYQKRPSRANMQPRLNSVWFARMKNTIKVYSFTEANKEEKDEYILSTGFAGILCNPKKVNPKYLEKIFLSEWFNNLKDSFASDKAIQKSLNNKDIVNLEIPLPPLSEQKKIVYVLDSIQEVIRAQEKIIEKTKELKKALLNEIFNSKFKNQKSKLQFKIQKWIKVKLKDVVSLRKEQVLPKVTSEKIYVGLEHIDSGETKLTRWGDISEVKSSKNVFYHKDVLYGKLRPYLDKAVIAPSGGVCSTDILVLSPQKNILPEFLVNLLHLSNFVNFAISETSGTNHPRTSWNQIKEFCFPLPPLSEQREIAEILQTIDQKIEIEQKKKALYEELFRTTLNKLMTGEIKS